MIKPPNVSIPLMSEFGLVIEDSTMYEISLSWDEAAELYQKLSIALSVPKEILPLGGKLSLTCAVEEFVEDNRN